MAAAVAPPDLRLQAPWPELKAPASWAAVEFISDLHLQAAEPATFDAWRRYMAHTAADALFILGDLFEAWPGDDCADAPGFSAECVAVLRDAAGRRPVFFMHGNRDFLAGPSLMQDTGMTLLADPTVLLFRGQRMLLSHGDALCLGDTDYLRFREEVRQPEWQRNFLAQPLAQREGVARALRAQSETRKRAGETYADVDAQAAHGWLIKGTATLLIHGHTHKPAEHELAPGLRRIVLSDWDANASPPRLEALRLDGGGMRRVPAI